ncbi:MAG: hypothetical protein ACE5F6_11745 [Anaerolineae bacterium]
MFVASITGGPAELEFARQPGAQILRAPHRRRPNATTRDPAKAGTWYTVDSEWHRIPEAMREAMRKPARARRLTPYLWYKRHYLKTLPAPRNGTAWVLSIDPPMMMECPCDDPAIVGTMWGVAYSATPGQTPNYVHPFQLHEHGPFTACREPAPEPVPEVPWSWRTVANCGIMPGLHELTIYTEPTEDHPDAHGWYWTGTYAWDDGVDPWTDQVPATPYNLMLYDGIGSSETRVTCTATVSIYTPTAELSEFSVQTYDC